MDDGHAKTVEEVLSHFKADPERGLSLDQVKEYQKKYGPNGEFWLATLRRSVYLALGMLLISLADAKTNV